VNDHSQSTLSHPTGSFNLMFLPNFMEFVESDAEYETIYFWNEVSYISICVGASVRQVDEDSLYSHSFSLVSETTLLASARRVQNFGTKSSDRGSSSVNVNF